ncbi:WhiB family transcriptional regulator [Corynebacterium flavescens]|uniref:WhiB family transcriptional regulator n=1 Tax=Corynebacterium flavescens TaxID=28028 RepID=UPI003FD3E523
MTITDCTPATCNNIDNPTVYRAFINPTKATPHAVEEAIKLCHQCPLRKACADLALTSGARLVEDSKPAVGVIMAGVVCKGESTAGELARIAGRAKPATPRRRRPQVTGTPCKSCGKTLYKWTRTPEDIPKGHVMHHGRGFCIHCRKELAEYLASLPESERRKQRGLRKPIDRKRHHYLEEKRRARLVYIEQRRREIAAANDAPVELIVSLDEAAKHMGCTWDTARSRARRAGAFHAIGPTSFMGRRPFINLAALGYEAPAPSTPV